MSLQLNAALTTAVSTDLALAATTFPSATLVWRWVAPDDTRIQYRAEYVDSNMTLVIEVDLVGGPSQDYTSAQFWYEEEYAVSAVQSETRKVSLPEPPSATRAGFTTFAAVLAYVTAWRNRLA